MSTETQAETEQVPSPGVVFSNAYLDELVANVRARPSPYSQLVGSGSLPSASVDPLKLLEQNPSVVAEEDVELLASAITAALGLPTKTDAVQYTLALTVEAVTANASFATSLLGKADTVSALTAALVAEEATAVLAAKVLVIGICSGPAPSSAIVAVFDYAGKLVASEDVNCQDLGAQAFGAVGAVRVARPLFWKSHESYVPSLLAVLRGAKGNLQLQYYTLFAFWALTFDRSIAAAINAKYDLVTPVLEVLKTAIKEKIIRVSISTIQHLVSAPGKANVDAILLAGGLPVLQGLALRKWTDEDISTSLQAIVAELEEHNAYMSTFDFYLVELNSGRLKWGTAHKELDFWKRNADLFREDNWKLLKQLGTIISASTDPTVLAVACNDVTYLVTEQPAALKVLEGMGVKAKIMELMANSDNELKYQALKATQVFVAKTFA
ncbi:armadillo-type protein [Dipodascopsis tothii]|uniref:armadillo-type protein n=1 Tax=Dipodascopsis tothii TaxID=44089 RepID=UPI0034CFB8ED